MTDYTGRLRLAIQDFNENPDGWGTALNTSVFQLLDDALAGLVQVSLVNGNNTLTTADGTNDQARYMILDLTGALTAGANVLVPEGTDGGGATGEAPVVTTSKIYVAINNTTGGQTVTIKTASGSGVELVAGKATMGYCDGTDVAAVNVATADAATTASTATNSTQLGGVAASSYARKDQANTFTGAQSPSRTTLTPGTNVTIAATANNRFSLTPAQAFTLENPTSPTDGQSISILVVRSSSTNYAITWGSAWLFQNGTQPTLTDNTSGMSAKYDLISAEYSSAAGGWITGVVKDVRNT